jgi:hypothetical protein
MDEAPELELLRATQKIATMMAIRESLALIQSLADAGVITAQQQATLLEAAQLRLHVEGLEVSDLPAGDTGDEGSTSTDDLPPTDT